MIHHDHKNDPEETQNVHVFWADELSDLTLAQIVRPGDRRPLTDKIVTDLEKVATFSIGDRVHGYTDEAHSTTQAFSGNIHGFIAMQGRNPDTVYVEALVFLDEPIPSPYGKYFAIRVNLDLLHHEELPA